MIQRVRIDSVGRNEVKRRVVQGAQVRWQGELKPTAENP